MKSALFIGRFQPFHNGHLEVIKCMAGQVDKLIIAIGSAQESHTSEDPFTAGERHLMISESLDDEGIENYFLIPIVDINRYSVWVAHVRSLVPPFQIIFTNNDLTARLFLEAGVDVRRTEIYDRERYSGKIVRKTIADGGDWRSLIPQGTARVIDAIQGEKRIRELGSVVQ